MPPVFKALATITAWTLWICAWAMWLSELLLGILHGTLFGPEPVPMVKMAGLAIALGCAISSVVAMKLRQMLE